MKLHETPRNMIRSHHHKTGSLPSIKSQNVTLVTPYAHCDQITSQKRDNNLPQIYFTSSVQTYLSNFKLGKQEIFDHLYSRGLMLVTVVFCSKSSSRGYIGPYHSLLMKPYNLGIKLKGS